MNAVGVLLDDVYRAIGAVRDARGTGESAVAVASPLPDEIALVVEDLDHVERLVRYVQVVVGVEVHADRHLERAATVSGISLELAQPVIVERANLDTKAAWARGPHPGQDEDATVRAECDIVRVVKPPANRLVGVESYGLEVFHRRLSDIALSIC